MERYIKRGRERGGRDGWKGGQRDTYRERETGGKGGTERRTV